MNKLLFALVLLGLVNLGMQAPPTADKTVELDNATPDSAIGAGDAVIELSCAAASTITGAKLTAAINAGFTGTNGAAATTIYVNGATCADITYADVGNLATNSILTTFYVVPAPAQSATSVAGLIGGLIGAVEAPATNTFTLDISASTAITTNAHHQEIITALTNASLNAAAVVTLKVGAAAADLTAAAPFSYATVSGYAGIINAVANTSSLQAQQGSGACAGGAIAKAGGTNIDISTCFIGANFAAGAVTPAGAALITCAEIKVAYVQDSFMPHADDTVAYEYTLTETDTVGNAITLTNSNHATTGTAPNQSFDLSRSVLSVVTNGYTLTINRKIGAVTLASQTAVIDPAACCTGHGLKEPDTPNGNCICDAAAHWEDASGATTTDNARNCQCVDTKFKTTANPPTCAADCSANQYKNDTNNTCVACPDGTSDGTGDMDSCACAVNEELYNNSCTACPDSSTATAGGICKCPDAGEVLNWGAGPAACAACPDSGTRDENSHECSCTAPKDWDRATFACVCPDASNTDANCVCTTGTEVLLNDVCTACGTSNGKTGARDTNDTGACVCSTPDTHAYNKSTGHCEPKAVTCTKTQKETKTGNVVTACTDCASGEEQDSKDSTKCAKKAASDSSMVLLFNAALLAVLALLI